MTKPAPRPALQRAADSDVHPVSGRVETEAIPDKPTKRKKSKGATSDTMRSPRKKDEKLVTLSVEVPKPLRRKVRELADDRGISVDQMVTDILRAALD